jgi:hypothetical protein
MNDDRVSIVKVRNGGGNASLTIPQHIFKVTGWSLGTTQVFVEYDSDNNRVIFTPVSIEQLKAVAK